MIVEIRKTRPEEIPRVMEVIEEARRSIGKLGIDQWQDGYPSREIIEDDVAKGISYVIRVDFKIEGTVVFMDDVEPTYEKIYDGYWIVPNYAPYFVMHRLAFSDAIRGKGVAPYVVLKAIRLATANHCLSIRIDTHPENIPMRRMLEKNLFIYRGIIYLDEERSEKGKRVAYEFIV